MTISLTILGINFEYHYAECHFLFVIMLSVVMLSVVMLNVIIMSVVAPENEPKSFRVTSTPPFKNPLGIHINSKSACALSFRFMSTPNPFQVPNLGAQIRTTLKKGIMFHISLISFKLTNTAPALCQVPTLGTQIRKNTKIEHAIKISLPSLRVASTPPIPFLVITLGTHIRINIAIQSMLLKLV
jgi:hypothetical protein